MKTPAMLLACMMTINVNAQAPEGKLVGLEALRWQYRVILVFAHEPHRSDALANLAQLEAEIEERDIAWFVLGGDTLHTNYAETLDKKLRETLMDSYFTPVPAETAMLLVGKDGTVKSRSSDLDLEATFGLIDRMPMRREEMRR